MSNENAKTTMMTLEGKRVLLGVSGGIAAYKVCELVRRLGDEGASVQVVMTPSGARFVTPMTFQALSGKPVWVDAWDDRHDNHMPHIELSRSADVMLVAPASTNTLAKLALGLGDNLLTNIALAREIPLLVAPAMNRQMWQAPTNQRHIQQLRADGVAVLGPGYGDQACGEVGDGRMLEPHELLAELRAHFQPKVLAGRRILLTAGPTFEPIDPVRGITNLSSGKMGFALAQAAWEAGAEVTVVAGPSSVATPYGVRRISVQTAQDMLAAVEQELDRPNAAAVDAFIAVAAVADWRVDQIATSKIKKTEGSGATPQLNFRENPDILKTVAQRPQAPYCVGFAAETENLLGHAQEKRQRKGVPLLIGNIGPSAFGSDDNELLLIDANGSRSLPRMNKHALARQLMLDLAQRLPARSKFKP